MQEPTQKQTPMARTTTLKIARWRRGDGAFLKNGRMKSCVQHIERYHSAVFTEGRRILGEYDAKIAASDDPKLTAEANDALCAMARKHTVSALGSVLQTVSEHMKNGYARSDN